MISKENILDVSDDIKGKVSITYESKPIRNLYLMILMFKNSGNVPILPNDYYRPLSISFGKTSEILSVEVVNQSPNNLDVVAVRQTKPKKQLEISSFHSTAKLNDQEVITLEPILMNKNDFFRLKILVTGFQNLSVDTRISGIEKIIKEEKRNHAAYWTFQVLTMAASILLGYLLNLAYILIVSSQAFEDIFNVVAFIILTITILFYLSEKLYDEIKRM